jgi:hypothetical protein
VRGVRGVGSPENSTVLILVLLYVEFEKAPCGGEYMPDYDYDYDLTGIPETGLLDMVRLILSKPGPLTDTDRRELERINQEITDRDKVGALEARRAQYKVRRLRQKIKEKIK